MTDYDFDTLSQMTYADLDTLFRAGTTPQTLNQLGGEPVGRVLAIRRPERTLIRAGVRWLARQRWFYWAGKKVVPAEDGRSGHGSNRDRLGGQSFPYRLRFDTSVVDGRESIVFDYDHAYNNRFGRRLYNELRQVSPNTFLGTANWKTRDGRYIQLLWFALQVHRPLISSR